MPKEKQPQISYPSSAANNKLNTWAGYAMIFICRAIGEFDAVDLVKSTVNLAQSISKPSKEVVTHLCEDRMRDGKAHMLCASAVLLSAIYYDSSVKQLLPEKLLVPRLGDMSQKSAGLIDLLAERKDANAEAVARKSLDMLRRSGRLPIEVINYLDSKGVEKHGRSGAGDAFSTRFPLPA
ncbi:MAG: hypothetical protein Q7T16_04220 [Candidatus Burarchaeum sp.]|nr:hypothetical protein [Candidatus Burarchaeum sp.]MDO8339836.1 hypothetical protein [Candidatus Burarchaeum sp.]